LKKQAEREIQESMDKMKKGRVRSEEQEASLEKEEKVLESIQEGLKGNLFVQNLVDASHVLILSDKTQTFHDQIEAQQKELQPWIAKVNEKQSVIDIAQGERDALSQKAETIKKAEKEAEEILANKRADQQTKVGTL